MPAALDLRSSDPPLSLRQALVRLPQAVLALLGLRYGPWAAAERSLTLQPALIGCWLARFCGPSASTPSMPWLIAVMMQSSA